MAEEERKYSIREAAPAIGMSRSRLYELIFNGEIHARRIGARGRMFLLQSDIDRILRGENASETAARTG